MKKKINDAWETIFEPSDITKGMMIVLALSGVCAGAALDAVGHALFFRATCDSIYHGKVTSRDNAPPNHEPVRPNRTAPSVYLGDEPQP